MHCSFGNRGRQISILMLIGSANEILNSEIGDEEVFKLLNRAKKSSGCFALSLLVRSRSADRKITKNSQFCIIYEYISLNKV
ncbi:hypothetical protein Cha6605_2484 [Chamaesiphon minutus PCC 6605]|uniref:Uncharacterized protein n=1 Tax=Chamaesiphon minutus (strain ATCC 27169 / PCC 6605) TaxID=1173020 RepID=K9UH51_CHAP6|nr:hypothetical protein Cha6605_2484 [Chamaesiphon minutus PCC 6605]